MEALVLDGWRPGLRKVALTKILHTRANIPLATAKHHVDELLDGHTITLPLTDIENADAIARDARAAGAIAYVIESEAGMRTGSPQPGKRS